MQTRYGFEGNCFAACLASLLEIPLEDVPSQGPAAAGEWALLQDWLSTRGLTMVAWPAGTTFMVPRGWAIAGTRPPEFADLRNELGQKLGHAVVVHDGGIAHDPHPFDDPGPIVEWIALAALDAAKIGTR
ncbi:MAG: hypothetical protein QOJ81_1318 [Chloroflexota bacterium]|jgi:hypothetical protein|nr:hypothetical protein [Chloroflexota bacterium]